MIREDEELKELKEVAENCEKLQAKLNYLAMQKSKLQAEIVNTQSMMDICRIQLAELMEGPQDACNFLKALQQEETKSMEDKED